MPEQLLSLATCVDLKRLTAVAATIRDYGHADIISYSPQVFIPLPVSATRDKDMDDLRYFDTDSILAMARAAQQEGGHEIVFGRSSYSRTV